jgi:hypothetical protein
MSSSLPTCSSHSLVTVTTHRGQGKEKVILFGFS